MKREVYFAMTLSKRSHVWWRSTKSTDWCTSVNCLTRFTWVHFISQMQLLQKKIYTHIFSCRFYGNYTKCENFISLKCRLSPNLEFKLGDITGYTVIPCWRYPNLLRNKWFSYFFLQKYNILRLKIDHLNMSF